MAIILLIKFPGLLCSVARIDQASFILPRHGMLWYSTERLDNPVRNS